MENIPITQSNEYDYVYIVKWDDSVQHQSSIVHHFIKLNPGVNRSDFEKFMKEEGFPQAGEISTRIGRIESQYLLAEVTGSSASRFEDLDLHLESFGTRSSVKKFIVPASWKRAE